MPRLGTSAEDPGAVVGQAFTSIVGTVGDQNPLATASDYANSTIDWGDGTAVSTPTFETITGSPGNFNIIGSHTYTDFGTYEMVINVQDSGGGSSSATYTVYLPAPTISVGSVAAGVDQALEVPVSLSGSNVASQSLTIVSYDSSVIQAAWENGGTTDANGNANLLVTGVAVGQTDLVVAMANFANVQGDAVQQVQHNTVTLSSDDITVCTHTGGQSVTATVTAPNGQPVQGVFLEQEGFPNGPGSYSLSPFNGPTNAQGQWTFKVIGVQYNSDEPDDLQIEQLNDPGAFASAEVNVVVPQLTISANPIYLQWDGQTAVDTAVTVKAVDPTNGNPITDLPIQISLANDNPDLPVATLTSGDTGSTNRNGTINITVKATSPATGRTATLTVLDPEVGGQMITSKVENPDQA